VAKAAVKDAEEEEEVAEAAEEGAGEGEGAAPAKKRWSGKRLVLFVVAPVLVLGAAGGGLAMSGMLDSLLGGAEEHQEEAAAPVERKGSVFHDLPEMLVNLNTAGRRTTFLKITVSLELEKPEDVARIREVMPRILDNFQVYLRELRLDDLRGSAGMYRLREELLARVNAAAAPAKVRDVLFKEMLVQ
jgi:flagellar FliL protein